MSRVCELREKLEQYKDKRAPPPNQANDNLNNVVVHGENKKEEYGGKKKTNHAGNLKLIYILRLVVFV